MFTPSGTRGIPLVLLAGWLVWMQVSKSSLDPTEKRPTTSLWELVTTDSAFDTRDACEAALAFQADAFEFIVRNSDPDTKRHGKTFLSHDDTYIYSHEFFCLPDTVDPRGAKGER